MSKQPKRIYTERDWQAADPLDRLYMHLMEPQRWVLNSNEDDRLDRLRKVWAIMCEKATTRERIALISEQVEVTERTVYRDMEDAKRLFGDILNFDIELELRLAYDRYMELYEKAKADKDYDTARRCHDSALGVLAQIEQRTPKKQKIYPQITFTDDPKALRSRNDNSEALDFEEIPSHASLLERETVELPAGH